MAHAFDSEEVDLDDEVTEDEIEAEYEALRAHGYSRQHALELMGAVS